MYILVTLLLLWLQHQLILEGLERNKIKKKKNGDIQAHWLCQEWIELIIQTIKSIALKINTLTSV